MTGHFASALCHADARGFQRPPAFPPGVAPGAVAPETADNGLQRWCRTTSLEERLEVINTMAKKRLPSQLAAEVWLRMMKITVALATPAELELQMRQFIMLAPEHAKASMLYDLLMNGQAPGASRPELVFMITSCARYMPHAQRVLADLQARGAHACIVIGDPSRAVASQDGALVTLPVSDSYEALTVKVLEGLTFLRRRHGAIGIVKIDDDMRLNDRFDPAALAAIARTMDYAGHPMDGHAPDRCWHLGKTSAPTPIFTRRHRGRFAYGPMYVLGSRAIEHLVREWVFFPGEFAGEIYEDHAVGDALRRAGIDMKPIGIAEMGGIVNEAERYVAAPS